MLYKINFNPMRRRIKRSIEKTQTEATLKALDKALKEGTMKTDKDYAIEGLKALLKPGDKVYCICRHVSRSGMMRHLSFYTIKDNDMRYLDGYISQVLDYKRVKNGEGLKVHGCGMDMGFSVVYNLGSVLFPDGFKVEGVGRNGDTSGWDRDGGYTLKHVWL